VSWDNPDSDPVNDLEKALQASRKRYLAGPRPRTYVLPGRMYDRLVAQHGEERVRKSGLTRAEKREKVVTVEVPLERALADPWAMIGHCECGHREDEHVNADGRCMGTDSYDCPCDCPSFELSHEDLADMDAAQDALAEMANRGELEEP